MHCNKNKQKQCNRHSAKNTRQKQEINKTNEVISKSEQNVSWAVFKSAPLQHETKRSQVQHSQRAICCQHTHTQIRLLKKGSSINPWGMISLPELKRNNFFLALLNFRWSISVRITHTFILLRFRRLCNAHFTHTYTQYICLYLWKTAVNVSLALREWT